MGDPDKKMYPIIRWVPAILGERDIPGCIKTEEEAIEYAKEVAKNLGLMFWLVLSRKDNVDIAENGSIRSRNEVAIENSWLPFVCVQ